MRCRPPWGSAPGRGAFEPLQRPQTSAPCMVRKPLGGFTGLLNQGHHFQPCFLQPAGYSSLLPQSCWENSSPNPNPNPKEQILTCTSSGVCGVKTLPRPVSSNPPGIAELTAKRWVLWVPACCSQALPHAAASGLCLGCSLTGTPFREPPPPPV